MNGLIDLYLDDTRRCPAGFVLTRNADECILLLKECEVRILSLDYDLGPGEPTGLEVARFIALHRKYADAIYLHTSSPSGRMLMYQTLYAAKPDHVRLYGHAIPDDVLRQLAAGRFELET